MCVCVQGGGGREEGEVREVHTRLVINGCTTSAVVWTGFSFIRSGQNHLARHSEREKKTGQTEDKVGRQHQGMDRPGVWKVPQGSGEQGKMEKNDCKSSVVPQ